MTPPDLPDRDFDEAAELLRALAHAVRLQILCAIKNKERSVGEIEEITGIGQPGLSQQLAILRKAQLVQARREGKQVFYRVDRKRVSGASDLLDALAGTSPSAVREQESSRPFKTGGAATFARVVR